MPAPSPPPTTITTSDLQTRLAALPSSRALKLLHVEDDPDLVLLVERLLRKTLPAGSAIEHAANLSEAVSHLATGKFDAILLDLSLPDCEGAETVRAIRNLVADVPILVLTGHEDPELLGEVRRHGAEEVLYKSRLNGSFLSAMLQRALAPDRAAPASAERRRAARYLASYASVVIPMLADHRPGSPLAATTVDLSHNGAGLLVEGRELPQWDRLVLGVERADGTYCYATAVVRHRRMAAAGCHHGVEFVAPDDDPLSDARLAPRLDPETFRLVAGLPEPVLHAWAHLGVVRPFLIDRVRSCPRCSGLPTFRDGCRQCGSVRTSSVQYIHHFACAHVAPAIHFDSDSRLACPKCRARNLIVGSDFEYLSGPIRCLDCNWTGTQLTPIAECLKCGQRFLASEAPEIDVFQFHVERLDPLAFV